VQSDVVRVTDFGDAKVLADRIRERTPVVLDLRSTDPDMVRRIIDFASGLTYALDGTMAKTADGVVLVLPPRVTLGQDEQRRLQGQGLYELPESVS
jgi:cell division inhibitor SepF